MDNPVGYTHSSSVLCKGNSDLAQLREKVNKERETQTQDDNKKKRERE